MTDIPKKLTRREQRWMDTINEVKAMGLEAALKDKRLRRWLHRLRRSYLETIAMEQRKPAGPSKEDSLEPNPKLKG